MSQISGKDMGRLVDRLSRACSSFQSAADNAEAAAETEILERALVDVEAASLKRRDPEMERAQAAVITRAERLLAGKNVPRRRRWRR